ncbi:MAG: hypothetical protein QOI90_672 [Mycobacterium sp.]|nr:hypothetical protein [Mycobacterium sp.]
MVVGRALLFLDVDGTLLPGDGTEFDATLVDWQEWQSRRNPWLARIDRTHGRRLLALACDLVWATAWMHDANEVIAPLLGLPPLPVADLPEAPLEDPIGTCTGRRRRWSQLRVGVASSGSTTRSPTSIVYGWAHITEGRLCFIVSIRGRG